MVPVAWVFMHDPFFTVHEPEYGIYTVIIKYIYAIFMYTYCLHLTILNTIINTHQ
jgi:hypothetical protein